MGKTGWSTPLLFQSKLLCFSLFYLSSSIFLALYTSLSASKCLFRSSPFDPIQFSLFSYPSSYGEHKYAVPTLRSSCSTPVFFSGNQLISNTPFNFFFFLIFPFSSLTNLFLRLLDGF